MSATGGSGLGWYARRLARMSPAEMAWRARDQVLQAAWSGRQVTRAQLASARPSLPSGERRFTAVLPSGTAARVPEEVRKRILRTADRLLEGEWEALGVLRTDMERPDWFRDPVTARRSAPDRYAFRIDHRSEEQNGNIKQIWELSRLQHLTLLAVAWAVSRDERYARRVADQLGSWWEENPFLSGVHWTSGIEIGIRLISLTWIRRLLDDWPGGGDLFERNGLAVQQIRWHQQYLAALRSRGSSANNHVIAEAAGQFVASCAFPWFGQTNQWRRASARMLERELLRNTFPSGINRELASDYHCFVGELGFLAAVEAEVSGRPLSPGVWQRLAAIADSAAALLDERMRPPRQGDSDEGRALLLDAPAPNSWPSFLALAGALIGPLDWWPSPAVDAGSSIIGALLPAKLQVEGRPEQRPSRFADAGITLLRTTGEREIWCRCDGGPHGFLSIAAHAHADALSVEVRHAGIDILADPGTYCYHGDPAWRAYFRSTLAHNTAELGGRSQSRDIGPFMWAHHANAREIEVIDDGDIARWIAEHDGYASLDPPALHRRSVLLDRASRSIDIIDEFEGSHDARLAFHFGPEVQVELRADYAILSWHGESTREAARLELPPQLRWSLHRGETDPILGWYSPGLGCRVPVFCLVGRGRCVTGTPVATRLEFVESGKSPEAAVARQTLSSCVSDVGPGRTPETQAEPHGPAGARPAEVHPDRAAGQGSRRHSDSPGNPRWRRLYRRPQRLGLKK